MEPARSQGLMLPQPSPSVPLTEVTRDVDVEATVVRPVSPQRSHSQNEVTTRTTTTSSPNRQTLTTVTTRQSRRVVENGSVVIQRMPQQLMRPGPNANNNVDVDITDFTLTWYLQYISDERLIRMPDRDNAWDRVLNAAQYFGLHIAQFGDRVDAFANGDTVNSSLDDADTNGSISGFTEHNNTFFNGEGIDAFFNGKKSTVSITKARDLVSAALASSHALLEIGHAQAQALLPTFTALYEFSVLLTDITRIHNLHTPSEAIRYDATKTFNTLVVLLGNITAVYRQKISDLKPGSRAHINFDASFGAQIREIWQSKEALSDAIWKHKLQEADPTITAKQLRWKLQYPYNYSVVNKIYEKVDDYHAPSSRTCYWLKDVLSDFFSGEEKLLCLTGENSSGKTYLSRWVEERLARPLNVKSYHVLRYTFPRALAFDSPDRATPSAFLKSILFTLLEQNISNVGVYKAIAQAFQHHSARKDSEPTEAVLWKAFNSCLAAIHIQQASIVIVLDDCDEIVGIREDFYAKLQECITGLPVQVVAFCRSIPDPVQVYARQIEISKVREDIRAYIRDSLSRSRYFRHLSRQESDNVLKSMTIKAGGDWLWAFYAVQLISKEKSKATIIQTSHELGPKTLDVLLKVTESLELDKNLDLKNLLSMMLVAARPLSVAEMEKLLSIDLQRQAMSVGPDVSSLVSKYLCDLVMIREGHLHFRTKTVRSFIKEQLATMSLPFEQEAQKKLTLLMLLYVKFSLKEAGDISSNVLDYNFVLSLFSADSLLGYVVQNWVEHFQASGFTGAEVSEVFPKSITFALLERTCWARVYTKEQLVINHKLAFQIRQDCFSDREAVVVHNLVTLGHIYLNILGLKTDASFYFYEAAKLGKQILSDTSTIVKTCMETFFDCVTGIEINDTTEIFTTHSNHRIDILTWHEAMLRLAVEINAQKHGIHSDEVISWYQKLAKFYADIKREEQAMGAYQEIRVILTAREGKESHRVKQMNAYFATLDIVLNGAPIDKVGELEEMIFETSQNIEITDLRCIELWMRLAHTYETCESFEHLSHAERLYVNLWQRITADHAPATKVDIHLIRINIALEYARFLSRHNRIQEACSILICLWAEYQKYTLESETIIIRIREVAEECRKAGLSSIAVSMLTKVLESFSTYGSNEEVQKTVLLMNRVVEEVSDTTVTKSTTDKTVVTEETESVVKRLFERLADEYEHDKTDTSLFSAVKALISLYNQQNNWREAEAALKKTLQLTWKEMLTDNSSIRLCEHSIEECIAMARRLADCYSSQKLFEMAEKIHLQIFYACISVRLEDNLGTEENPLTGAQLFTEAIAILVAFYEEHHRHREVIDIYAHILAKYEQELGQKHEVTITTLYFIADYYETLGLETAYEYYAQIVTLLNGGLDYCHHDAIKAALALSVHYDARRLWDSLQAICTVLWETIIRLRGQRNFEGEQKVTGKDVASIYQKYSHVLDFHGNEGFSKLYSIAVEYKDIISDYYYDNPQLVINALITLAKICETHDEHHEESIKSYEQVLDKLKTIETTDTIEETTVETVKKRLSRMYVTIVKGSSKKTFSLKRAIEISLETYHQYKAAFEDYPEQTMHQLDCVILLYQQMDTEESRMLMRELLVESAQYIITAAAVNLTLFHAATSLAALFVNANLIQSGKDLLEEMRKTVIYGETLSNNGIRVEMNSQTRKAIFIFLIAFGHGLDQHAENLSYSKVMAEIVLESLLYEEYSSISNEEAAIEVILQYGARLRRFWQSYQRDEFIRTLDDDLIDRFKAAYSQYFEVNCSKMVKEEFYYSLMDELGKDRPTINFDFDTIMLEVGNSHVKSLLDSGSFDNASQVGRFMMRFSGEKRLYHDRRRIRYGYILAQFLVGIGASRPDYPNDTYGMAMVETSQSIMHDVINAFDTLEIDFETLRAEDLIGLINLLHAQSNHEQLERVLSRLWDSRGDVKSTFGSDTQKIIEIGTFLVHVQCALKLYSDAIRTAEQLYYNLQRARGRLHKDTLEVSRLLASIYATMASNVEEEYLEEDYFSYAMDVHHNIMREINSPSDVVYNGYTRHDHDHEFLKEQAWIHSSLLNNIRSQLNESQSKYWTKREKDVRTIYESLTRDFKLGENVKDSQQLPSWKYTPPKAWRFNEQEWGGIANGFNSETDVLERAQREWVLQSRIFI
ncbi:hypothetical protein THAR02_01483 [Trichoderma harzianum]|uniref:Nephrocystin 3-like N-terminal domain-containing protein n=1 Tax=Trichoderma harzianum TaxID=5544 RepID=A0A0G0A291_TRIHA|nr:hypothetical protein THAR02_01483 [Trichoderma harzianum]